MSDPARFRLATLNLLMNPERMGERLDLLVSELQTLRPDAVCLQEILGRESFDVVGRLTAALGWRGVVQGPTATTEHGAARHGAALIAPRPFTSTGILEPVGCSALEVPMVTASTVHDGHHLDLISAHLTWGAEGEPYRQAQALAIDAKAKTAVASSSKTTVLIGGDFNAVPTSDTARFFDGHTALDGRSTVWVDAWTLAGDPSNEMTSRNDNSFAHSTAKSVGISHPSMIPERRIDYLKSFGWSYGRSGHPLDFGRWATSETNDGLSVSDHYGIWADFLLV